MAYVNIPAVLLIIFYYFTVMYVGVWGGRKVRTVTRPLHSSKETRRKQQYEDYLLKVFVANREMPIFLGIGSMTATWVGGGYLNGTAEAVYKWGIVHCHAPLGYALSLLLGGYFFAEKMRKTESLTMLDPLQSHYGNWTGLLFSVPAVMGELFWTAAILSALGETAIVIMGVNKAYFIILSGVVIFFYTTLGGFYSVAYTDAFQVVTTALSLWACVPSSILHKAVGSVGAPHNNWIGAIRAEDATQLLDFFAMTALGGIPWQVYFQRVLSCENAVEAKVLSFLAAIGCIFLAIPPVILGIVAKNTNFTAVGYEGSFQLSKEDGSKVLPFTIHFLTSGVMSIFGLIGITAAVMSSADSSMLSASTMITRNVYHSIMRPSASDSEVVVVLRATIVGLSALAVYMALSVRSVLELWTICSDVVYVLLFPQFVCCFFFKETTNSYGSVIAFFVGGVFRCLCGEPTLSLPVVLKLPLYDEKDGQRFPFRFVSMLLGLCAHLVGSCVATTAFAKGWLPQHLDVCQCFVDPPHPHSRRQSSFASSDPAGLLSHKGADHSSIVDSPTAQERRSSLHPTGVPGDARKMSIAAGAAEAARKKSLVPNATEKTKLQGGSETALADEHRRKSLAPNANEQTKTQTAHRASEAVAIPDKQAVDQGSTTKASRKTTKKGKKPPKKPT
ncbi:high-affinity choline transporter 1-like [Haemaphysalis longicornis]